MNNLLREAFRIILVMIFFLHSPFTIGEEQVSWAGFSFISQADETEKLYPFSLSIEKSVLRPLLTEMVVSQKKNYNLTTGLLDSKLGESKAIVVALDKERITGGKLGKYCYWEYALSAQVILFDTEAQNILSIFPVGLRRPYVEESQDCSENSRDKKRDRFRFCQMYLGLETDKRFSDKEMEENCLNAPKEKLENGLLKDIASVVSNVSIKDKKNIRFIGIGDVAIKPRALSILSGEEEYSNHQFYQTNDLNFDSDSYANWIGQSLSKTLASKLNTPIVPLLKGKAIGGSIPLKFSDQIDVANLRLPELDFSFNITIRGFKKVKLDETSGREAWAYGSYLTISFGLDGMHKNENSSKIKNGYVVEKVKADDLNDWQQFDYSSEIALREFADNVVKVDKKWVEKKTDLSFKDAKRFFSYVREKLDSAK